MLKKRFFHFKDGSKKLITVITVKLKVRINVRKSNTTLLIKYRSTSLCNDNYIFKKNYLENNVSKKTK